MEPLIDSSGASIQDSLEDRHPTIVLPNQRNDLSHFAIDIGGSLIKLVYFSRQSNAIESMSPLLKSSSRPAHYTPEESAGHQENNERQENFVRSNSSVFKNGKYSVYGGRLHFVKFETSKLDECFDFIKSKKLNACKSFEATSFEHENACSATVKATGGGAFRFSDDFKEKLNIVLNKEDEMNCLVSGCNFLLRAIRDEAFTHLEGNKKFVKIDENDLFPYLLVNIGSGVSMIKVDGPGKFERVSGTNVGGGTFWGLGKLLTNLKNFDDILELSQKGDNSNVDMLVGDIYGGLDYSKIGLSASTIASSFGKVINEPKGISEYQPQDMALSLLRMISYNIGQISYLNAIRYNLKKIFFGGFFIRGHAYTMDTMSFAIHFWSKGEMQAMFLRHEGFLGAMGAFLSYEDQLHNLGLTRMTHTDYRYKMVEKFPMGAPYVHGEIMGPTIRDLDGKISWMEKFVMVGSKITEPTPVVSSLGSPEIPEPVHNTCTTGLGGFERPMDRAKWLRSDKSNLNVGVLHLTPNLEPFPLLSDIENYDPNTIDLNLSDERKYWFNILESHMDDLVEKAVASEGKTDDAKRRGEAFVKAFKAHISCLRAEPFAYGKFGLANLFELREECLREFQFFDAYSAVKLRENEASLSVLPDLLSEIDNLDPKQRLLALTEGLLAANIFDWGSKACVELYQKGTILEIYKMSRNKMKRPWRIDDFDLFQDRWFCKSKEIEGGERELSFFKRALLFADNSGADIVLGLIPFARELLRRKTDVIIVANSLPAINDVTAYELYGIIKEASKCCDLLKRAAMNGNVFSEQYAKNEMLAINAKNIESQSENTVECCTVDKTMHSGDCSSSPKLIIAESGSGSPCIDFRYVSAELATLSEGVDLIILEGMGRSLHTNYNARFKCDALKVAMIKNQRLAEKLVSGSIYDCVFRYESKDT